ncbi:hypothetical protein MASR1M45_08040 [Candidatus Kapaibacterium sp.]
MIEFIQTIEKDKLLYFILASSNKQNVLIIKSPSENREKKNFFGYEWSTRKGKEGIKYIGASSKAEKSEDDDNDEDTEEKDDIRILSNLDALSNIETPLYDNDNPLNEKKINYYVQQNFLGNSFDIPENLESFVSCVRLVDMLDFKKKNFDKMISLTPQKNIIIDSKWNSKKIIEFPAEIKKGTSITQKDTNDGNVKVVAGGRDFAYFHNEFNRLENTITISASGAYAGYVNFWREKIFASDCTTVRTENITNTMYIYYLLKFIQNDIYGLARGQAQPHVYPTDIENIKIPVPSLDIQKKIVSECEAIDKSMLSAQESVNKSKSKMETEINSWFQKYKLTELSEIIKLQNGKGLTKREFISDGKYLVYGGNGVTGNYNEYLVEEETIVIGRVGEYCGSVHLCEAKSWITDNAMYVTNYLKPSDKAYLYYVIKALNLNQFANKGGQPNIAQPAIMNKKIPFPDTLKEQEKLVKEIEKIEKQISEAENIIADAANKKNEIIRKYL